MRNSAFFIRVGICFLLSLIPATEVENRIYSMRMEVRGRWSTAPELLIVEVNTRDFNSPEALRRIRDRFTGGGAELVLVDQLQDPAERPAGMIEDPDGSTRRAVMLPERGNPSLAYQAYVQLGRPPQGLKTANIPHWINYIGPQGSISRCKATEDADFGCGKAQGKWIILFDEDDASVTFHTPLGEMDHAEISANDIHTVIAKHPIHRVNWLGAVPLILAAVFISAFYIIYYPVLISALAVVGTGVAAVIVAFQLAFQLFHVYIPSANIIGALLITYLIFTGYRLAVQENLQWRALKQAQFLRELNRMQSNFLSLMSHDLKTPLAKIQAVLERMRRESALPEGQRSDMGELLDSIENSNNELKHYIMSILNLSKIESQKVILNMRSNDINQLIQQTIKRLKPLIQQKNLVIEERLEPLFSVECDEDLMRQILTNIIDNAVKYSPAGSRIIVSSREEDGKIHVDVEDFGPGIPKDQLPLMFRKFHHFLRPMKGQVKGSGLGLYLSKYFIELHGGGIRLKSVEGQGTVFSITLPVSGLAETPSTPS